MVMLNIQPPTKGRPEYIRENVAGNHGTQGTPRDDFSKAGKIQWALSSALILTFSPSSSLRFDAIAPEPKAKADRRRNSVRVPPEVSAFLL
jgi:hypothetical protein